MRSYLRVNSQLIAAGVLFGAALASAQPQKRQGAVPSIARSLPELWRFLEMLTNDVNTGAIGSTEQLTQRCRDFYTPARMAKIESVLPGWRHMASFENASTLWHVNEAMVSLFELDEYRSMPPDRQTVQQWIVLLHDVAKEPVDGRDHRHPFRSAAQAGRILPRLGFPVTAAYASGFADWFTLTDTATRVDELQRVSVQDNRKLPQILAAARRIFAEPTRTAVTAIALHQSITSLAAWPVKAPLTVDEIKASLDQDVLPALLALTLADTGGWNLFDRRTLASMQKETRAVFDNLSRASKR